MTLILPSFQTTLHDTIIKSSYAIFQIGVYLCIIMSLYPIIDQLIPAHYAAFPKMIMEFSSGSILITQTITSIPLQLCVQSALLGFAGFCVHMQVMAMIPHLSISYFQYLSARIFQAIIAFLFAFFIFLL